MITYNPGSLFMGYYLTQFEKMHQRFNDQNKERQARDPQKREKQGFFNAWSKIKIVLQKIEPQKK
jgi:hypothetical protein